MSYEFHFGLYVKLMKCRIQIWKDLCCAASINGISGLLKTGRICHRVFKNVKCVAFCNIRYRSKLKEICLNRIRNETYLNPLIINEDEQID